MARDAPLRLGIIGLGQVTVTRHLPALRKLPQYKIVAAADIDAPRVRRAAAEYQIARGMLDAFGLIQLPDVDAVAICTPPGTHAALLCAALDAKKFVFVEKPLTLDAGEADMIARQPRADTHLLAGFNLRHHAQIQRAHEWLRAGRIGKIRAVHTTLTNVHSPNPAEAWRRDPLQGGDVLFELGVHHFDACRFLCGAEFETVRAQKSISGNGAVTLTVQAQMTNDILATCVFAQDTLEHNSMELIGERGRMTISCYRFDGPAVFPRGVYDGGMGLRLRHAREMLFGAPRAFAEQWQGGAYVASYRAEWEHFYRVARNQEAPLASVSDGVAATRAAHAARMSL